MVNRALLLSLLVLGCGAKEPAKSAANVETPAPQPESRQEAGPASAAAPKAEPAPAPAAPASPDDVRDVLQAVIDDDALTPYLHLEQRGRFPLRVSARGLPQGVQLMKMSK